MLLVLLTILVFTSCTHEGARPKAAVERVNDTTVQLSEAAMKNIRLTRAENREFPEQLSLMGRINVTEDRMTLVPARVAGRIDRVDVTSGEKVVQNQALASLFSADYLVAREEYVQALKQSHTGASQLDNENLAEMSRRKLVSLGLSPRDIAGIDVAEKNPSANFTVRAPRSGVILDKKAIVGNFVNVGDTLFTVGDLSKVWFEGDLYPEDLPRVHKDQDIVIQPESGEDSVYGKISFISPVVDPTTRTVKIRALMDNPGLRLRADMYVRGDVTLNKHTALLIPSHALIRLGDVYFCFKRTEGNRFQKVPVEMAAEQAGWVVVKSGIQPGDEVVSEGALLLEGVLSTES